VPRVELGLCLPADRLDPAGRGTYVENLNRALDLVDGHFGSAWIVDHLQFGDADVVEGFTALAYMAALHPRLTFGHTVLCQSFRNPALVAKMAATLQMMSGGRFVLGMGAGWHEEEYRAYGYDFPSAGARVEQLDEALRIIRALWTEDVVTFAGRHHRVVEARCQPRPDPPPIVMVGAFKPRMLRLTARHADWWNVSSTSPLRYTGLVDDFARACDRVGRDPATVRRSWGGGCACAATRTEAEALARERFDVDEEDEDDFNIVGTPDDVVDQMRAFVALGVDHFIVDWGGFPDLTGLELLVHEVLPALNA
jgi:alkanesulfonate monooxygenase SsuD/methylene tetrahydromethanopterin reductase-like flavin-dependent oxidoreductase (luciferase family)